MSSQRDGWGHRNAPAVITLVLLWPKYPKYRPTSCQVTQPGFEHKPCHVRPPIPLYIPRIPKTGGALVFVVWVSYFQRTRRGCPVGDVPQDPESDLETIDPSEDERQDNLAKQRKKAGLPEIDVNSVPSTLSPKMMNLEPYSSISILILIYCS